MGRPHAEIWRAMPGTRAGNEHPNLGFTAWMVVAWTMAGGILLGGVYVAFLTATNRMSAAGGIPVMSLFFGAGALLGFIHGALLGFLGRPQELDRADALKGLALGILGSVPGLGLAWVLTLWIGITVVAPSRVLSTAGIVAGWLGGGATCLWAVQMGWHAVRNLADHWADARLGGSLLAGTFLLLSAAFAVIQPEIWWTNVRVTRVGAVLLALGATVWIGGPLVILGLTLLEQQKADRKLEHH